MAKLSSLSPLPLLVVPLALTLAHFLSLVCGLRRPDDGRRMARFRSGDGVLMSSWGGGAALFTSSSTIASPSSSSSTSSLSSTSSSAARGGVDVLARLRNDALRPTALVRRLLHALRVPRRSTAVAAEADVGRGCLIDRGGERPDDEDVAVVVVGDLMLRLVSDARF